MKRQTPKVKFDEVYERLCSITKSRKQLDMAKALGIKQSSVSQAIRQKLIPDRWLLLALQKYGVNPEWLLRGDEVQKYMIGSDDVFGHSGESNMVPAKAISDTTNKMPIL